MKRFYKWLVCVTILMLHLTVGFAQIDPCTDPLEPCPIDSGVVVLVAVGVVLLGVKSYRYAIRQSTQL